MRNLLLILLKIFVGALAIGCFFGFMYLMTHTDVVRYTMGTAMVLVLCYALGSALVYAWNESNPDKKIKLSKRK